MAAKPLLHAHDRNPATIRITASTITAPIVWFFDIRFNKLSSIQPRNSSG